MANDVYIGARIEAEDREALEQLARRRRRTLSDELRLAVDNHLRAAKAEEGGARAGA